MHRILLALLLGVFSSGCDVRGLTCGIADGFRNLFEGVAAATGAVQAEPMIDDDRETLDGVLGLCGGDDCNQRDALVGARFALQVDFSTLMEQRGIVPEEGEALAIRSDDDDVLRVQQEDNRVDGCSDHLLGDAVVTFVGPGEATLEVRSGERGLASFTFRAHTLESLELVPEATREILVQEAANGDPRVRALSGQVMGLEAVARNAEGDALMTGGATHLWVEDVQVAAFVWPLTLTPTLGEGSTQRLQLGDEGETRIHALLGGHRASIELQVQAKLTTGEADGGAPDPEVDGGVDARTMPDGDRDADGDGNGNGDDDAGIAFEEDAP